MTTPGRGGRVPGSSANDFRWKIMEPFVREFRSRRNLIPFSRLSA
jgi:hypothetical protein